MKVINLKFVKNKRTRAMIMALVVAITYILSYNSYLEPMTVMAGTITGTVNGTDVNVRTGPGTSYASITKLNIPDQVTILEEVSTSDTFSWYKVGFNLNGTYTEGYMASTYVTKNSTYTEDADFEAYLTAQGFPESYKPALRNLHANYPKWVFKADHINHTWDETIAGESVLGRNLISGYSITSWKSTAPGAYNPDNNTWVSFDSGYWVAASTELIQYALDPRNFINPTNIFMFEDLTYNPSIQTSSGVGSIAAGSFIESVGTIGDGSGLEYEGIGYDSYSTALIKAAECSGVNPYHLASKIIQEMGVSGASDSISGTTGSYPGIYNYYNWGAYASGGNSAITNGLKYASYTDGSTLRPWNSRMRAIIGGAIKLNVDYISRGQDTPYYQKFNVKGSSLYTHQYMTNVLGARSESSIGADAYSDSMKRSVSLAFNIPVYQNMPAGICEIPTGNASTNNYLSSLSVSGTSLTPTFNYETQNYDVIVGGDVSSVSVYAEPMASTASISGVQSFDLNFGANTINVVVTAQSGDTRTYTINVVRQGDSNSDLQNITLSSGSITPAFNAGTTFYTASVPNGVSSVEIGASTASSYASVAGTGYYDLNVGANTFNLTVTTQIGTTKTYTVTVNRADLSNSPDTVTVDGFKVSNESRSISGITVGSSAADTLAGINVSGNGSYSKKIVDSSGNEKTGAVGTGNKLVVSDSNGNTVSEYTFVVYGDVNGDGQITSMDLAYVKVHLVGGRTLEGVYATAADVNKSGGALTSMDLAYIKTAVLGLRNIVQ